MQRISATKETEKFTQVVLKNLPPQDYMKAKEIYRLLNEGEYSTVNVNDIAEFKYYCDILSLKPYYLLIKPSQNGLFTVCKRKM